MKLEPDVAALPPVPRTFAPSMLDIGASPANPYCEAETGSAALAVGTLVVSPAHNAAQVNKVLTVRVIFESQILGPWVDRNIMQRELPSLRQAAERLSVIIVSAALALFSLVLA
jgi:hypothetical protein